VADDINPDTATNAVSSPENIDQLATAIQKATSNDYALFEKVKEYVNVYLQLNHKLDYTPADVDSYKTEIIAQLGDNGKALATEISNEVDAHYTVPQKSAVGTEKPQKNVAGLADPVSMYNGQFVYDVEEVHIAGAGMDFSFRRIYKNQVIFDGPLGSNWNHSCNIFLRENQQRLILNMGDFVEYVFMKHPLAPQAGFDYYIPPGGLHAIVQKHPAANSFVMIQRDGTRFEFEPDDFWPGALGHRIKLIEDRFGNYLGFDYDNVEGLLQKVRINSEFRFVKFQYDTLQRITGITDHTNRIWTYIYDDWNDLIACTSPATAAFKEGLTNCYEYSSAYMSGGMEHNLLRIIDAKGQCYLENEYGFDRDTTSFNKVIRQRRGSSGVSRFEYEVVVEDFDFDYSDANRPAYQTNFFERNGHPIHFIYNIFGNLLLREEQIVKNGSIELLQTHYRYNLDGALTSEFTPEGVLTQSFYGRDYYLRKHGLLDKEIFDDPNLDSAARLSFGDLLTKVRRHTRMSFAVIAAGTEVWEDIFPDILGAVDPEDIIVKYQYEPDYGQLLAVSNPRFTQSVDPDFPENAQYAATLTRNEFRGPAGDPQLFLAKSIRPATTQADGTVTAAAVEEFVDYDAAGRPTNTKDALGVISELSYDSSNTARNGFLNKVRLDPGGLNLITTTETDELGRIVKVFSPLSAGAPAGEYVSITEYDELEQTIRTTASAPFNYSTRFFYDQNKKLTRQLTDAKEETGADMPDAPTTAIFAYDDQLNLVRESRGGANLSAHLVTLYTYNECDKLDVMMLPAGNRVRHRYDERLFETRTERGFSSADEAVYRTDYDNDGLVIRTTSPKGNTTKFTYDVFGRKIRLEDALGNMVLNRFDKAGNLVCECACEKKAAGYVLLRRSEYVYDEQNRKIKELHNRFDATPVVVNPADFLDPLVPNDQLTLSFFYDAKGQLIKTVDALAFASASAYDNAGRLLSSTDAYGNQVLRTYDANGNLLRVDRIESLKNDAGVETGKQYFSDVFAFDQLGRKISETDTLGNRTSFAYDSFGNVVRITDPLGNIQRSTFDIHNRRIAHAFQMTDTGLGGGAALPSAETRFDYDANGTLTDITDPNGNRTEEFFDALDRKTKILFADGSISLTSYDPDSNVLSTTDNNGLVRNFTVDPLGRVIKTTLDKTGLAPGLQIGGADQALYKYDGIGRQVYAENNFCTTEYVFNGLGWLIQDITRFNIPVAPLNGAFTTARKYDDNGALTEIIYPSGRKIALTRDPLGRIAKIFNTSNGANYPGSNLAVNYDLASYRYHGNLLSTASYFNGTSTQFGFDKEGKIIELDHTDSGAGHFLTLQQLYDAMGNIRFKNSLSPANNPAEEFKYDSRYQLTKQASVVRAAFNPAYFVPFTNPIADPIPATQQTDIDPVIGPLLQPAPAQLNWVYDQAGNLKTENEPAQPPVPYVTNQLNEYTQVNAGLLRYDLSGNLIQNGNRQFVYDASSRLVRVIDAALPAITFYHDAAGKRVLEITGNQATHLIHDGLNLIEEYRNGNLFAQFVHGDQIDRPVQIAAEGGEHAFHTDLTGSVLALTDNAGNKSDEYKYNPFGIINFAAGAAYSPYRYSGKRFDAPLGSYDSRSRQYDPALGRFLQRDAAGMADGANLYSYTRNNPLTFTDQLGTERDHVPFNLNLGNFSKYLNPIRNWDGPHAETPEESYIRGQDPAELERLRFIEYQHSDLIGRVYDRLSHDGQHPLGGAEWMTEFTLKLTLEIAAGEVFALPFNLVSRGLSIAGKRLFARAAQAEIIESAKLGRNASSWWRMTGDVGGRTRIVGELGPYRGRWSFLNKIKLRQGYASEIKNRDLYRGGTWFAIKDTGAHEAFHAFVNRYFPTFKNLSGRARVGAFFRYPEEVVAYAFGHGAALRFHQIPFAPLEAFGSLSKFPAADVARAKLLWGLLGADAALYTGYKLVSPSSEE
jgi:RHS repeat-associated protein